jgi:hypothetical protein
VVRLRAQGGPARCRQPSPRQSRPFEHSRKRRSSQPRLAPPRRDVASGRGVGVRSLVDPSCHQDVSQYAPRRE